MSNIVGVRVPPSAPGKSCNAGVPGEGVTRLISDRDTCMRFLSYAYRMFSNFVFLALVYYSLNFLEKYQQRAIVAILVLIYAAMRAASALRSFYFFQRIERLQLEARRLAALTGDALIASRSARG